MFGAFGIWQIVTALTPLAQDHTVPVARTAARRTLQTEREMKKRGRKSVRQGADKGARQHGVIAVIKKRYLPDSLGREQQLIKKLIQGPACFLKASWT